MADNRQVPEQTSTLAFEDYTSSKPVLPSIDAGWQNLIVRTYQEPQTFEHLIVPVVPDPHTTGESPNQYITRQRIDAWKWLQVVSNLKQALAKVPSSWVRIETGCRS